MLLRAVVSVPLPGPCAGAWGSAPRAHLQAGNAAPVPGAAFPVQAVPMAWPCSTGDQHVIGLMEAATKGMEAIENILQSSDPKQNHYFSGCNNEIYFCIKRNEKIKPLLRTGFWLVLFLLCWTHPSPFSLLLFPPVSFILGEDFS